MLKKNVLFISGVADDREVMVSKIDNNGKINWRTKGSANVSKYLENDLFQCLKVVLDTRSDQELPRQMIHGVFNEISDADTHKITLDKANQFYQAISPEVPFFNIPSNVMKTSREQIYQLLQGIEKLHVPKTIKIQSKTSQEVHDLIKKEGFEYPVIFRQAGDHGGISTIRVENETEQFYSFPLDGRDYYLTQFVEYVDEGLYKKYRLMVIDGEVYLRHVKISEEWMVHHRNQIAYPEKLQKIVSKSFLSQIKSTIQPIVNEIHKRLQLDYFGIDCYIDKNMNLLIFEINPSMNIFNKAKKEIFNNHLELIRSGLIKMIINKLNNSNTF